MNEFALIIAIILALIAAAYFRQALIDSMSNVHVAQEAQEYLKRDTVNITLSLDKYLYTNISVIPKADRDEDLSQDDNDDNADDADDNSDDNSDSGSDSDSGGDSDGGDGGD